MYRNAAYQVGVVTVAPSGSVTITPLLTDTAYTMVCIACLPLGSGPSWNHQLDLYIDGVLKETHNYIDGTWQSTHMLYSSQVFPPNVGLKTNPTMNGFEPPTSIGFQLIVTNNEANIRDFCIYSTFEMFTGTACRRLTFQEVRR